MTVKQAAAELAVSAALVYALCAAGKIRHERHGLRRGTIRITPEALEEYRKSCTSGAKPPPPPRPASCLPASPASELNLERVLRAWERQGR